MLELTKSGLSVQLNTQTNELVFGEEVDLDEMARKTTEQMKGVLAYPQQATDDIAYDFYKNVHFKKDAEIIKQSKLRYDLIVIYPGTVGSERKKTSGHIHNPIVGETHAHPELYEVISGTAYYVLQPVKSGLTDASKTIVAKVEEGHAILVPSNYMHCTVNAGTGALVFSNLVLDSGTNSYDGIEANNGMSVYVIEQGDDLALVPNPNYEERLPLYRGSVIKNNDFGTQAEQPVYTQFIESPQKFEYLRSPENYLDTFEQQLQIQGEEYDE